MAVGLGLVWFGVRHRGVCLTWTQRRLFHNLNIDPRLLSNMKKMGIEQPLPLQATILPRMLSRESLVVGAPTGSGKTLCFMLPILQHILRQQAQVVLTPEFASLLPSNLDNTVPYLKPNALVLVPTVELAAQTEFVARRLAEGLGIKITLVTSSQARHLSTSDILIATPGSLVGFDYRSLLANMQTVVLDELDLLMYGGVQQSVRMILTSMARHLLPGDEVVRYEKLKNDRSTFQLMAAGATLPTNSKSSPVFQLRKLFPFLKSHRDGGLHRRVTTVHESFVDVDSFEDKLAALLHHLEQTKSNKTMVFVNSIVTAQKLFQALNNAGYNCVGVFRQVEPETRGPPDRSKDKSNDRVVTMEKLQDPNSTDTIVAVCTDLASRGLDIPGVELVVQFEFALSVIDYLHRIGRTARAGRHGQVVHLVTKNENELVSRIRQSYADMTKESHADDDSQPAKPSKSMDSMMSRKRSLRKKSRKAKKAELEVLQVVENEK